jgi:Piwi domain
MGNIRLNFLALANQDHPFQIFRSAVNIDKPKKNNDYRASLPANLQVDDIEEKWKKYDISLDAQEGYTPFDCKYATNHFLSEFYLFERLKHKLISSWVGCHYSFPSSEKYKQIEFNIELKSKGVTQAIVYPYFLKSENKLGFLFNHHFHLKLEENFDITAQIQSLSLDSAGGPNVFMYRDKEVTIRKFIQDQFLPFMNENFLNLEDDFISISSEELLKKSYITGENKISTSQFMGIKQNGPYRKVSENARYLFLFSERTRSLARDVYLGLTGKLFPGQFSGLENMFHLHINNQLVDHHVLQNFDKKCLDELRKILDDKKNKFPNSKIMLVVVLPKGFKGIDGIFDAYGYLKFLALENNFFCQFITEDSFLRKEQLKWSISNIGLQIFSKLGGAPWLVKPAKKDCLIFGLGSAHEKLDGEIKKFIAYTVCLDSSGDFKYIKPLSTSENKDTYLSCLRIELDRTLREELAKSYSSIVLHLPFKIKKDEIKAIKEVVSNIGKDNSCEFIVLKINTHHRFMGFSDHNTRVPYESSLIKLSYNQFILWTEGLQHGKEILKKRVSEPLLIDFLELPESWKSKKECLQDVLNLTGANWRGFNSKAQPISILYSKLIADFMKEFSHIEGCDDLAILRTESVSPWFL